MTSTAYSCSEHAAYIGDRAFTVRNLRPTLPNDELVEIRRNIENTLFDIFRKYMT